MNTNPSFSQLHFPSEETPLIIYSCVQETKFLLTLKFYLYNRISYKKKGTYYTVSMPSGYVHVTWQLIVIHKCKEDPRSY